MVVVVITVKYSSTELFLEASRNVYVDDKFHVKH